jgi:hypothetical protein
MNDPLPGKCNMALPDPPDAINLMRWNWRGSWMGTWLLILSCLGDPAACDRAVPWKEARFGSEKRCMVEGESIVARVQRTNIDDNVVITYSCRPYTEEDAKGHNDKDDDHDGK